MNQCLAWVLPLGVSILLGACGGGEDQTTIEAAATGKAGAAVLDAQAIGQLQAVAEAHLERKQALAAVPGADLTEAGELKPAADAAAAGAVAAVLATLDRVQA